MAFWQKIVCAVDFSDASRLAMDQAAFLARLCDAELALVHVYEELPGAWQEGSSAADYRKAQEQLESWRKQAAFLADRPVSAAMLQGSPSSRILEFAREGGHDAIVVGTRGRNGLKELLLGSVAEHVLRRAHCPVLAVRAPPP